MEEDPELKYLSLPKYTKKDYKSLVKYLKRVSQEHDFKDPRNNIVIGSGDYRLKIEVWEELTICINVLSSHEFKESFNQRVLSTLKLMVPSCYRALTCSFEDLPKLVNHKLSKFIAKWRLTLEK